MFQEQQRYKNKVLRRHDLSAEKAYFECCKNVFEC